MDRHGDAHRGLLTATCPQRSRRGSAHSHRQADGPSTNPVRRDVGGQDAGALPRPDPNHYMVGVMSAASWALMLCKPGMRPPTSVGPGTCATVSKLPKSGMLAPCVGRLSGASSPPRGIWVDAVAGRIPLTSAFTSGRVISVEPLRNPFAMSAGAVRTAAIAADGCPACTAPVNATALEFSAASALPGAPIASKTSCKPGPKFTAGTEPKLPTAIAGLTVVLRLVSPLIMLVAFCDICARIEPGGIRLVKLCAICPGRAPTGARAPNGPAGMTGTNTDWPSSNAIGSKPGRPRLCRPCCRALYAPTGLPANRSPKAVWTPAEKAGAPVIKALDVPCTAAVTVCTVPIWPPMNICAKAAGLNVSAPWIASPIFAGTLAGKPCREAASPPPNACT